MVDLRKLTLCLFVVAFAAASANAQSIALLTPNKTALDKSIVTNTRAAFLDLFRVQDPEMSEAAYSSFHASEPFNMTTDEARNLGAVLGCDFFILVRSGTQRRAAINASDYFESYAAFFIVSSRTGRLIAWKLESQKGTDERDAEHRLVSSLPHAEMDEPIVAASKSEPSESQPPVLEEIPEPNTPAAKDYRSPVPYRRLKPDYTRTAYLYDVTATVEITVDLDQTGKITRTEIARWAGYGLDESVTKAVTSMNWRPAERSGKPLPARFLLRYNFKKIEKEEPDNE
jgi:hypothetical protein